MPETHTIPHDERSTELRAEALAIAERTAQRAFAREAHRKAAWTRQQELHYAQVVLSDRLGEAVEDMSNSSDEDEQMALEERIARLTSAISLSFLAEANF